MTVPIDVQITSAKRELRLRRNVYPKWIESRRMSEATANLEIASMEAIIETLEAMEKFARAILS